MKTAPKSNRKNTEPVDLCKQGQLILANMIARARLNTIKMESRAESKLDEKTDRSLQRIHIREPADRREGMGSSFGKYIYL